MIGQIDQFILRNVNSFVWYIQLKYNTVIQNIQLWLHVLILIASIFWIVSSYSVFFLFSVLVFLFMIFFIFQSYIKWKDYNNTSLFFEQVWNERAARRRKHVFSRMMFLTIALMNFTVALIPESNFFQAISTGLTMLVLMLDEYIECCFTINHQDG